MICLMKEGTISATKRYFTDKHQLVLQTAIDILLERRKIEQREEPGIPGSNDSTENI